MFVARIRSKAELHKDGFMMYHGTIKKDTIKWRDEWKENFTNTMPLQEYIDISYYRLMKLLSNDIGVQG